MRLNITGTLKSICAKSICTKRRPRNFPSLSIPFLAPPALRLLKEWYFCCDTGGSEVLRVFLNFTGLQVFDYSQHPFNGDNKFIPTKFKINEQNLYNH